MLFTQICGKDTTKIAYMKVFLLFLLKKGLFSCVYAKIIVILCPKKQIIKSLQYDFG